MSCSYVVPHYSSFAYFILLARFETSDTHLLFAVIKLKDCEIASKVTQRTSSANALLCLQLQKKKHTKKYRKWKKTSKTQRLYCVYSHTPLWSFSNLLLFAYPFWATRTLSTFQVSSAALLLTCYYSVVVVFEHICYCFLLLDAFCINIQRNFDCISCWHNHIQRILRHSLAHSRFFASLFTLWSIHFNNLFRIFVGIVRKGTKAMLQPMYCA